MPNERIEEYTDMWGKENNPRDTKSVISDFVSRIQQLEGENVRLRSTIKQDVELISKTEDIVRKAIRDKEELERGIREKDMVLKKKNEEISLLKVGASISKGQAKPNPPPPPPPQFTQQDLVINQSLIVDLQSQLGKKKSQIAEFQKMIENNESRMEELEKVNESLTEELIDKTKSKSAGSSSPLESLVQDLQSEINRHKKSIKNLKEENSKLKDTIEHGGPGLQGDKIKALLMENESLRNQLDTFSSKKGKKDKLKELQDRIKEKDRIITQLQKGSTTPISTESTGDSIPMNSLVNDLQKKINKMKTILKEKDDLISSLRGY